LLDIRYRRFRGSSVPPRDQISLGRGAINYREETNPGESGDLLSPCGKTGVDQKPLVGLIHEYVGGFGTPPQPISSPRVNERLPSETAVAAIASEMVSPTVAISSIAAARGAMWCFPCAARRSALPWP